MTARGFFGYSREEKEVMAEHEQNQHEQWVEKQLRTDFDKWAATVKNIERLSTWAIWKAAKTK
jgi:hypothetical protein